MSALVSPTWTAAAADVSRGRGKSVDASAAVDRISLYLIPLQMFVLSRIAEAFPDRKRANQQLVFLVILYSAAIQFVWLTYAFNANFWIPYQMTPWDPA